MNKYPKLLLPLLPIIALATDDTSFPFLNQKIDLSLLSLTKLPEPIPIAALSDANAWYHNKSPSIFAGKEFVSEMPIVAPKADIDPKMIQRPDSSIDYKLIVKAPDVESKR